MKKLILLIMTAVTVFGCSNDIQFNSPAIQGKKNGELWRSVYYAADIDFGGLVIEGGDNVETVLLVTRNDTRGRYELGVNKPNEARFTDANGVVYSTLNAPDESLQLYPSDGEIVVEDFDNSVSPKTVTGTFWFNAYTSVGLQGINFNEGRFYRISLVGGLDANN